MAFACPGTVEPEPVPGRHQHRRDARAQGELHVQQGVETPAAQLRAQVAVPLDTGVLVKHDELDSGDVADQLVLELAQDPREPRRRPGVLQRADDWQHVAHVAQRRQAQDADGRWRCGEEGLLHLRFETVGSGAGIVNNPHR